MDLSEIINAWVVSFNPTPQKKEKSISRKDICLNCDKLKINSSLFGKIETCGICGCPISKKIFSQKHNPCPIKKWEDVDLKYGSKPVMEKNKKTLL